MMHIMQGVLHELRQDNTHATDLLGVTRLQHMSSPCRCNNAKTLVVGCLLDCVLTMYPVKGSGLLISSATRRKAPVQALLESMV